MTDPNDVPPLLNGVVGGSSMLQVRADTTRCAGCGRHKDRSLLGFCEDCADEHGIEPIPEPPHRI